MQKRACMGRGRPLIKIAVTIACLLLFSGCKKEAPTASEPSTPPPPATLVDLRGIVMEAQVPATPADLLPGATVWLDSATAAARSCLTDSLGAFTFTRVAEGPHTLRVSHASLVGVDTTIVVSEKSGLFYLYVSTRRVTLAGVTQALDRSSGTRTPLAGACVSLDTGTVYAQLAKTDASGGFTFTQVREGVHHLRVSELSIVTLDTQLVVSGSMGALSITAEALPTIEIFPLALGAQWVYDFTCWYHHDDNLGGWWHNNWQRGTERFTVLSVSDVGAEWRWTIREEDDLIAYDTTWSLGSGYTIQPEAHLTADFTFSMYERKTGLHSMRNDTCSALWKVPWPWHGIGDPQDQLDYSLTRYTPSSRDTVIYQKLMSYGGGILEFRTLVRNVGLVQCYIEVITSNNTPSWRTWWGTLRSYTPGQPVGAVIRRTP